jgi:hypothetical protein
MTVRFLKETLPDPWPAVRERNSEDGVKSCRKCGETKRTSEFRRNSRTRAGLSAWCASCHTEAAARWRAENPAKVEARNAERRRGPSPRSCVDCGRSFGSSWPQQVRCPDCQAEQSAKARSWAKAVTAFLSRSAGRGWNLGLFEKRSAYRRTQAVLHRVVELVAVVAAGRVGAGCVDRAFGEDGLECFFDEAFPVFGGLPRLVHSEDAVLVEAGAVMDESLRLTFGVDLFHARVVVEGAAVIAGVELDNMCVRHSGLLRRKSRSYANRLAAAATAGHATHPIPLRQRFGWSGRVERDLLELLEPLTPVDDDAPESLEHDVVLDVAAGASIELDVDQSSENLDVEVDILDFVRDRGLAIHKRSCTADRRPKRIGPKCLTLVGRSALGCGSLGDASGGPDFLNDDVPLLWGNDFLSLGEDVVGEDEEAPWVRADRFVSGLGQLDAGAAVRRS